MPHWVFQLSPRMFANPFLEQLSYCSWYNILFVPYLLMFYYYYTQVQYQWHEVSIPQVITYFLIGIFAFSFTEYVLHRFVFHSEKKLFDNRLLRYVHFITHGIHHMFPFDPFRLVLPPAFTAIILTLGYYTVYQLTYQKDPVLDLIFWTGYLTGYIMYDLIHYMIHQL